MRLTMLGLVLFAVTVGAATPEQEAALKEIERFTAQQQRSDPHYAVVEDELLKEVDAMVKTQPPARWAPSVKRWYFTASERAHAKEQAAVRAEEAAAVAAGPSDRPAAWMARVNALDGAMQAGKLAPREHALRMLEAAKIIYPDDALLVSLRQTKLSLATDYELGNITRAQYDERWTSARASYEQSAAAREAVILDAMRAEQAAIPTGPTLGDRFRRQRGVTCAPLPGGAFNCR